ncbi:MAG TPA: serine/threonine-protein kinase [Polyangia bacterium]|nr:serine/threonine-protein kinase [Polyangia bacterium]
MEPRDPHAPDPTSEPAVPDPRLGRVLQGRYRIICKLASGAMGIVYKGERVQLGRPVAIKFLHPWIAAQKAFLGRFENEARAMSRLAHPHCVSVIDFGVEGSPYLVMDFVTGTTLREVMQQTVGRMPVARALHILRQLLAGLTHAHAQGIIHRDLKPDNIILSGEAGLEDHLRILDFGLAKLRDGPAMTAGLAIGTPSYMSPEQIGAAGDIDARSDLYSVGVLMFELLAGVKPFRSDHVGDLLLMHRETTPPAIREVAPDAQVSPALEAVVQRALAKSPADRFQTAAEFTRALEETPEGKRGGAASAADTMADGAAATSVDAGGRPAESPAPSARPAPAPSRRQRAQRRAAFVGGALALIAVGALVAGAVLRGGGGDHVSGGSSSPHRLAERRSYSVSLSPVPAQVGAGAGSLGTPARPGAAPGTATPASGATSTSTSTSTATADRATALTNFQEHHWATGVIAAEKAVHGDPALNSDPELLKGVVQSLAGDRSFERSQLFLRRVGAAATPLVKEAARHDPNPKVRERAADILDEGGKRSFFGSTQRSSSSSSSSSSFFKR